MAQRLELLVNGRRREVVSEPDRLLLWVLRHELDLCGTKYGCGEGACGACTILLDGRPRKSCLVPVGEAVGKSITTIEGLADGERLHPLQEAFLEVEALQCGYCSAGMILQAAALLAERPNPTEAEIVAHMNGNICRCGTYHRIVRAIRLAASRLGSER